MSDAIDRAVEQAARVLAITDEYDGCFERLDAWATATGEQRACGDVEEPMSSDEEDCEFWRRRARALAEAGLLAALPTPVNGCQCTGHSQGAGGGHVEYLLEYEPSCPEHSEHVWNPRTGVWEHADRAEGDGSGAEREPTVPASQLRAFARLCVDCGDMTPAAARMLDRIIDGDARGCQ